MSSLIPSFDHLTLDPSGPQGNAWGLFGKHDQLGMLNYLTPANTQRAAQEEIRTGVRISLDWELDSLPIPLFGRQPLEKELLHREQIMANDDVLKFNSQVSSQWDGFRHYGNQKHKVFFNGHTQAELESSNVIGIQAWVEHGGIVGRGVFLDCVEWAEQHHIDIDPLNTSTIPVSVLKEIAKARKIEFRPGDILLVRSGFIAAIQKLSVERQKQIIQRTPASFGGVESGENMLRWLWENQFAAVAGDAVGFESMPLAGPQSLVPQGYSLHQWCLAGWGMPLGELFDLEQLAAHCKQSNRYTLFFASTPLKIPGTAASPPNALAIF